MKIKRIMILVLPLALLMLFAAAAPAFAYTPKPCLSFVFGEIVTPNPSAAPPTVIPTANGEFVLGLGGIDWGYSSVLGYQALNEVDYLYINTATATGWGAYTIVSSVSKEVGTITLNGLSSWTYTGPTFTYNGPTYGTMTNGATITSGTVVFGVYWTGTGIIHYTSGPLAGETAVGTWAGITLPDNIGIGTETICVH